MKKLTKREENLKKNLNVMAREVRKLPPTVFKNEIVLSNVEVLKRYGRKIEGLVKKHHGIIYGSALFTDAGQRRAGMRKTDDLDVTFTKKSDMEGFSRDVLFLLGKNYGLYYGRWTVSISNLKTRGKLIDMHVSAKYGKGKALEYSPRYVRGGSAATKKYQGGIRGDDPRIAAVKKYNAAAQSLIDAQTWRIEKDLFDSGLIGRTALNRAKKLLATTKNPKQKKDLQNIISRYERAMMQFQADSKVMRIRKNAEKKYLRSGKVTTRTFTDPAKMRREKETAQKYGVRGAYQNKRKTSTKGAGRRFVNLTRMI